MMTVWVVVQNDEPLGEAKVFSGELVENNLVEVGELVKAYKLDDSMPYLLRMVFPEGRKPKARRAK